MADKLNVALLALDIAWADPHANVRAVERYMEKIGTGTDIVALPELFTTAFVQD